jgi:hypothetical protein
LKKKKIASLEEIKVEEFIRGINEIIEIKLKEYMGIKSLNKNDLKKYGRCEKNSYFPFRGTFFL